MGYGVVMAKNAPTLVKNIKDNGNELIMMAWHLHGIGNRSIV